MDQTRNCDDNIAQILAYHQLSKHHLHRYAPGPGYLDWANQPDPFRTFAGAPHVELPLLADALTTSWADLSRPGAIAVRRPDVNALAVLFELALGLSAWKEYRGSRWALRCNPSSGNLHPTEGYAIVPALPGLEPGVYHYVSRDHVLERRRVLAAEEVARLASQLPPHSFCIGLSSIHWREAWKYGLRAFRYCQHDAGHALAAFRYAAAALGWTARLLDHLGDDAITAWLGLVRNVEALPPLDREHADALLLIAPNTALAAQIHLHAPGEGEWLGEPNSLSREHVAWEAIDQAAAAAWQPPTAPDSSFVLAPLPPLDIDDTAAIPAARLIRQRRSCLALDAKTPLDAAAFYRILDRLLPRPGVAPLDMLPWRPLLHVALFVHRVRGLDPGLYFLERSREHRDSLRAACSATFSWRRPPSCPEHLPMFLLRAGDFRDEARTVSCHQEIASDGAFSLGMIACMAPALRERGPWHYRRLFWEAGVLGQVLYLGAEAAGMRGTGIGCYFDDAMHRLLGLSGDDWQDLYHFTVGAPVEDARLRTLEPYAHLQGR